MSTNWLSVLIELMKINLREVSLSIVKTHCLKSVCETIIIEVSNTFRVSSREICSIYPRLCSDNGFVIDNFEKLYSGKRVFV